jgi:hypothetical protein
MVLFAGDSAASYTPRRDIYVPDPAKMLIGHKYECKKAYLVF